MITISEREMTIDYLLGLDENNNEDITKFSIKIFKPKNCNR